MSRQEAKAKTAAAAGSAAAPPASTIKLPLATWEPNNHLALKAFCSWLDGQAAPKACAFDWDDTCMFGDIGDLSLAWQLETLCLQLSPSQLQAIWQPVLEAAAAPAGGAAGRAAKERADALFFDAHEGYALLYPKLVADKFDPGGAKQRYPQAHHRFRAKMLGLCQLLAGHPLPDVVGACFAAQAAMWGGQAPSDISSRVPTMVTWAAASNRPSHWFSGEGGRAGTQRVLLPQAPRPLPEMQALLAALAQAGSDVFIVSASPELIVRGAISHFRYGIASERVVGMRLAEQSGGDGRGRRTLPRLADGTEPTYRAGKVEAYKARAKSPPLLVAGDAMTDLEMLTGFAATKVRLLMHRPPLSSELASLAGNAWTQAHAPDFGQNGAITLVQGRDQARRTLAPSRQSR